MNACMHACISVFNLKRAAQVERADQAKLLFWLPRPRPHVSEYFWIRNFFFPDTPSVLTYPANSLESGTFWIRSPEWTFFYPIWIRNRVDAKSRYYFYLDDLTFVNKIEPNSLPWNQFSRWLLKASWRKLWYLCFLEKSWALEYVRIYVYMCGRENRPFPSSWLPPFQRESKCEVFLMKITVHSYVK